MTRALLVIDIQTDYFPGGALPLWQAEATEIRVGAAIEKARCAGDRIVLVQHVSREGSGLFAAGAPGTSIRSAMHRSFAFQGPDLRAHLVGVSELLIYGMMTQNCVVFTTLSDEARGFERRIGPDLCAARTETIDRIAVDALRSTSVVVKAMP